MGNPPGKTVQTSVSFEIEVVAMIEELRGRKSFSRFVNDAMREFCSEMKEQKRNVST